MAPRDLSRPVEQVIFEVESFEDGMRLDAWLHQRVTWRSRADLQRRIQASEVLVDGRVARKGMRVRAGQQVSVRVSGPGTDPVPTGRIPIRPIFEDRWIIALDKAPGTVCHPVGRHVNDTLINALHARHHAGEGVPGNAPPMIVHRLDQDTSGVLVLAKDPEVRKALGRDFEEREVEKRYLAVVSGPVEPLTGQIDRPIGEDTGSGNRTRMACTPDGRPSRTDFEVIWRTPLLSLVQCTPKTGRQHQIRVHLAEIGHPVLCDRLYGRPDPVTAKDVGCDEFPPEFVLLERQALHAHGLRIRHPITHETLELSAPLPGDFRRLLLSCPGAETFAPFPG